MYRSSHDVIFFLCQFIGHMGSTKIGSQGLHVATALESSNVGSCCGMNVSVVNHQPLLFICSANML